MQKNNGLTLIELMIVIAIMGVVMTFALPSFNDLILSSRLTSQVNDFVTSLATARSEALRRGAPVCVKRLGDTEKDWSGGWEVFVDGTTSRTFSSDSDRCSTKGDVLQTHDSLTNGSTLKSSGTNYKTSIRFNAMGVPVNNTDTGISDTFDLCRQDNKTGGSKSIAVSTTGLVTTSSKTCS